jgi:hypothetical protein
LRVRERLFTGHRFRLVEIGVGVAEAVRGGNFGDEAGDLQGGGRSFSA